MVKDNSFRYTVALQYRQHGVEPRVAFLRLTTIGQVYFLQRHCTIEH